MRMIAAHTAERDQKDDSGRRPIDYVTTHCSVEATRELLKKRSAKQVQT